MTQPQMPPQQPPQPPPAPPTPPTKTKRFGWPTLIITAVISFILAMFLIQSPSGYEGSPVPTETVTATETITETAAPTEEATKAPPTAKPTKAPPTEKALTRAQEQAIGTAKDYLD